MVVELICRVLSEQGLVLVYGAGKVAPLWRSWIYLCSVEVDLRVKMTVMIRKNTVWLRDGERDETKHHNYREALMLLRCNSDEISVVFMLL